MSATQEAVSAAATRRSTGEWHGLPWVLALIATLTAIGAAIAVFAAFADAGNFYRPDASVQDWMIAGGLAGSAVSIYFFAAVLAALRGILKNTSRS